VALALRLKLVQFRPNLLMGARHVTKLDLLLVPSHAIKRPAFSLSIVSGELGIHGVHAQRHVVVVCACIHVVSVLLLLMVVAHVVVRVLNLHLVILPLVQLLSTVCGVNGVIMVNVLHVMIWRLFSMKLLHFLQLLYLIGGINGLIKLVGHGMKLMVM